MMPRRPAYITEADTKRICKAAPDRVVEITLPNGTVIRLLPGGGKQAPKPEVAITKEFRLYE